MNSTEPHITVPLSQKAHSIAEQFAAVATSLDTGRRVYLNTLAVYAVHYYLNWLQIESDLEQGDSWNWGMQNISNVADLVIPDVGCLECRPILSKETSMTIPPQATEGRIGYVAVRLDESLNRAVLLGFLSAIAPSNQPHQISLTHLQPLDLLLERIPISNQTISAGKVRTNLSRWLMNTFENGWLTMEALFNSRTINPASSLRNKFELIDTNDFNSAVKRGKLLDLGIQLADKKVALIVACQPADEEIEIRLQVCPIDSFAYLPPNLQLTVLDEIGVTIPELQAQARSADNCIQLEFTGKAGERFSVKIALEEVSITEEFQI